MGKYDVLCSASDDETLSDTPSSPLSWSNDRNLIPSSYSALIRKQALEILDKGTTFFVPSDYDDTVSHLSSGAPAEIKS